MKGQLPNILTSSFHRVIMLIHRIMSHHVHDLLMFCVYTKFLNTNVSMFCNLSASPDFFIIIQATSSMGR